VSTHSTKLKRGATGDLVDAELDDALDLDDLFDAAKQWAPEKIEMTRELVNRNVPKSMWPQSLHWNWAKKAVELKPRAPGPLSAHRLFGISAEGKWQGLLLARCVGSQTRIAPGGRDLVYIELIETAPWNFPVPQTGRDALFKGVGGQLIELAIRWSDELSLQGRVGLHSLPQSEPFYRGHCGMRDFGPDPSYQNLCYFELDEVHARRYLEET